MSLQASPWESELWLQWVESCQSVPAIKMANKRTFASRRDRVDLSYSL